MKIEDNFLAQNDFDRLQTHMMGSDFDWYYMDSIDYYDEKDKYQFFHSFYQMCTPEPKSIDILNPILDIIQPISLWRIKANLLTRTSYIIENAFHIDIGGVSEEKLKSWSTSIFYINNNNGYTKFEDGTKVESVANRMVTFPITMSHTGTSCTDENIRVVINFNYFK